MKNHLGRILPDNLTNVALAMLFCALLAFQLHAVFYTAIWRDDAFFASVAKNIVQGNGYSAVFFNHIYPFHYGISTGPVLILPLAGMIGLFGNQYWVPGLTTVLIIAVQLIGLYLLARRLLTEDTARVLWKWFLYSFAGFILYTNLPRQNYGDIFILWHSFMGEIPATLFVLMGACVIFGPRQSAAALFASGALFGLAIVTKMITVIAIAGIGLVFCYTWLRAKKTISPLLYILAGGALPLLAFECFKLCTLGWHDYTLLWGRLGMFISKNAVDNQETIKHINYIVGKTALLRCMILIVHMSGGGGLIAFPLLFWHLFVYRGREYRSARLKQKTAPLIIALLMAGLLQTIWWIACSIGFIRHFVTGTAYFSAGLGLLLAATTPRKDAKNAWLLPICATLLILGRFDVLAYFPRAADLETRDTITEMETVRRTLAALQQKKHAVLFACGNNFELEYLLPGSRNFHNCDELTTYHAAAGSGPLVLVFYRIINGKTLLIHAYDNYGQFIETPDYAIRRCAKQMLATDSFTLHQCFPNPVTAHD